MNKPCLVIADFDDTLITTDSFVHMMKAEKWYLSPSVLLKGAGIVLNKVTGSSTLKERSRFKYQLLKKYQKLSAEKKEAYIRYFISHINAEAVDEIRKTGYEKLLIISASETELIRKVMENVLKPDLVIANALCEKEADFVTCWNTQKVTELKKQFPEYVNYRIEVWTDSESDRPLMDLADKVHMVEKKG